jgi:NAD(P)-dependent dehydrogenase (short-subunit alcohol dehydrogenase family)
MAKTVLITGANRGLGLGLLERYLLLPDHVVIAAVRDPTHSSSSALSSLPTAANTTLIIVKIDATVEADAFAAVTTLREEHNIQKLDVVIANAGVSYVWPKLTDVKIDDMKGHMAPNVYGVVSLYQATYPLLQKSDNPTFMLMGSGAGVVKYVSNPPCFEAFSASVAER